MEFNKCSRCGNFYLSNDDVCPKCQPKDTLEFETFKSYIEETGISSKNINRFLNYSDNNTNDGTTTNL